MPKYWKIKILGCDWEDILIKKKIGLLFYDISEVNSDKLESAKVDTETSRKRAIDSMLDVIYQINPATAQNANIHHKVEKTIDAIIEAAENRLSYVWHGKV